jgi:hypothetical protein
MEDAMKEFQLDPMHDFCNTEVGKLVQNRIGNMDPLLQLEAASMCQIFSFWQEIQNSMIAGAEEIKRLRTRIEELEKTNG